MYPFCRQLLIKLYHTAGVRAMGIKPMGTSSTYQAVVIGNMTLLYRSRLGWFLCHFFTENSERGLIAYKRRLTSLIFRIVHTLLDVSSLTVGVTSQSGNAFYHSTLFICPTNGY